MDNTNKVINQNRELSLSELENHSAELKDAIAA